MSPLDVPLALAAIIGALVLFPIGLIWAAFWGGKR